MGQAEQKVEETAGGGMFARQQPEVHAIRDDALSSDDAVGIAARIAAGEISALEAIEAAIERLEVVDPILHAVAHERF